jgi:glycosyltransferase involved in cell wall biosynthesis
MRPQAEPGLVSVVMPARNEEFLVAEAIASVLAQTYERFELIVVDDVSEDRTGEIAAGFPGVRVIRRESQGGVAGGRNSGLAVARGEYWTTLDADDVMPPKRLERQVAFLEENPSLGLVLGLTEAFCTAGEPRPGHWNPAWDEGAFPACAGTTMGRRELLDQVGPFDERLIQSTDVDWLARAKDLGIEAGRVDEVCLRYRIHPGNMSADHRQGSMILLGVLRRSLHRRRGRSVVR